MPTELVYITRLLFTSSMSSIGFVLPPAGTDLGPSALQPFIFVGLQACTELGERQGHPWRPTCGEKLCPNNTCASGDLDVILQHLTA